MFRFVGAGLVAAALTAAPVQASCWNTQDTAAATVRELQSLLMTATFRCHLVKIDITADYNQFMGANKATIQAQNDRIKTHFIKETGAAKGQIAYDAFTTSLANNHGSDTTNAEVCDDMATLAREAGLMQGSLDGLLLLAARQGLLVKVPDGPCQVGPSTVALTTAPTPAMAAAPGPVTAALDPAALLAAAAPAATAPAPIAPPVSAAGSPQ